MICDRGPDGWVGGYRHHGAVHSTHSIPVHSTHSIAVTAVIAQLVCWRCGTADGASKAGGRGAEEGELVSEWLVGAAMRLKRGGRGRRSQSF